MEQQQLQEIEALVEQTLWRCIDLKIEDDYISMGQVFGKLLAYLQHQQLISTTLTILVDPANCMKETGILLESLAETKKRYQSRGRLLTHRQILNVWLRKNAHYQREILPGFF